MTAATPISFARGAPSLDIIDVEGLRDAARQAFDADPGGTTAYGTSVGYVPLREWIAERHGVAPERVLVTNGSMQADAFLFDELVSSGDAVIVERPTYDRTLLALRERGADVHMVELEPDGIDTQALRDQLERGLRPTLAHVIPNFQNPAGYTLSRAKRDELLVLAAEHGFTIFEDDPYVALRFRGETLPTMLELDGSDRVVYASSFSKTVCPGVRVGYLVGAEATIARDRQARDLDLHLAEHGRPGDRAPVLRLRRAGALDRDRPHRAGGARAHAGRGAGARVARRAVRRARRRLLHVGRAAGGHRRGRALQGCRRARRRLREGVRLRPGGAGNALRLAYSGVTPEQIEEGVSRLADAVRSLAGAAASTSG